EQADKLYKSLLEPENDLTERARRQHLVISFKRIEGKGIGQLKDFEECFLQAQYEMYKMREIANSAVRAEGAELKKLEEKRRAHLKNVAGAFQRAVQLADAKVPAQDVTEARYNLSTAYLLSGDPYRAAILAEYVARARPPQKRSANAAGFAVQAYGQLL